MARRRSQGASLGRSPDRSRPSRWSWSAATRAGAQDPARRLPAELRDDALAQQVGEPQQIKAHFEGELDRVDRLLGFTNNDVRNHNKAMQAELPAAVAARRPST